MKRILTILSIGALATTMSYAQGTIVTTVASAAFAMYTNTAVGVNFGGPGTGGVSGKTGPGSTQDWYYQLLIQPYTGLGVVDNPNSANGWYTASFTGAIGPITNNPAAYGAVSGPGGASGQAVGNWGAPTGGSASAGGTEMYFMLVGWSGSLGSSWTTVYNDIVNNSWSPSQQYFVGWSAVGFNYAGGGPNSVPAVSIFGTTGLPSGFSMFETPLQVIPEPSTMVLAGLGGLSLLLFRRRK